MEARQIEVRQLNAEPDEKGIEKKIQVYTENIYSNLQILRCRPNVHIFYFNSLR